MLAWQTLKWWQRTLAVAAAASFIGMTIWGGLPAYNLPSRWIRFAGVAAILSSMVLNPASFGAPQTERGWRGQPIVCKFLTAGGIAAVLIGFMLEPLGV